MTVFHSHFPDLPIRGEGRRAAAKAVGWLGVVFKAVHHAIVAAKLRRLRRLRSELMLHGGWVARADIDAGKLPRYPLILSDKWDD
jgi:hypothetical protein